MDGVSKSTQAKVAKKDSLSKSDHIRYTPKDTLCKKDDFKSKKKDALSKSDHSKGSKKKSDTTEGTNDSSKAKKSGVGICDRLNSSDHIKYKKINISLKDKLSQSEHTKIRKKSSDGDSVVSSSSSSSKKKRLQLVKEDGVWKIIEVDRSPYKMAKKPQITKTPELACAPLLVTPPKSPKKKVGILSTVGELELSPKKKGSKSSSTSVRPSTDSGNSKQSKEVGWYNRTIDSPVKMKKKSVNITSSTTSKENRQKNQFATGVPPPPPDIDHILETITKSTKNNEPSKAKVGTSDHSSNSTAVNKSAVNGHKVSKCNTTKCRKVGATKSIEKTPTKSPSCTRDKLKIKVVLPATKRRKVTFNNTCSIHEVPRLDTPLRKAAYYSREDIKRFREEQNQERYAEIEKQFMEAFGSLLLTSRSDHSTSG